MKFGEKLKFIRTTLNLTQQELADQLGTTKQAISRYENSEREPNIKTVNSFAEKLGVKVTLLADDSFYFPFPDKIKSERERRGWSSKHLAELSHMSEDRLIELENFEDFPDPVELSNIAEALSFSTDHLLGREWAIGSTLPTLNDNELSLILQYRKLNDVGKQNLKQYADYLVSSGNFKRSIHSTISNPTIDERVEAYRQELLAEEKGAEESSPSQQGAKNA